jgi:acetoin:2,6-dichlorophenolindophenol oxidoreductase subunit alpha
MIKDIPKEILLKMYKDMLTFRRLDEAYLEWSETGVLGKDEPHRGAGEEAVVVGISANLRKDDYFKLTTRMRPCLTAKGLSMRDVIGTKAFKDLRGVGGCCTYYDRENGLVPYSGTLGEDVMVATGAALAAQLTKTDQVAVAIYGDGTGSRGSIHESMTFAAAWKLPIIFVVENNQYAMGTAVGKNYAIKDLSDRAKGYGFPGRSVDGNDVAAVYELAKEYIDRARKGEGPAMIAAETYRVYGHYEGDKQKYRPAGEAEEWIKLDPIPRYTKQLMEAGVLTQGDIAKFESEIKAEIDDAIKAVLALPEWKVEDYLQNNLIAEL